MCSLQSYIPVGTLLFLPLPTPWGEKKVLVIYTGKPSSMPHDMLTFLGQQIWKQQTFLGYEEMNT